MSFERFQGHGWRWRYDDAALANAESVIGKKAVELLKQLFAINDLREVRIYPRELRLTVFNTTADWSSIEDEVRLIMEQIYRKDTETEVSPVTVSFAVARADYRIYGSPSLLAAHLL
jgi:hypothetical protein